MGSTVYVGLATTASDNNQVNTSSFQNVGMSAVATTLPADPTNLSGSVVASYRIDLTWTDNANNENDYSLERATDSGFTQNLTVTALGMDITSFSDTTLSPGTTYYYRIRAHNNIGYSGYSNVISRTTLPSTNLFTAHQDIGSPAPAGSYSYDEPSSTYTLNGSGSDIWNTSDQFQFVYRPVGGDGSIIARVTSVQNTDPWAKAGVMFRDSLAAGAMFADMVVSYSSGVSFQWRNSTGGNCGFAQVTGISAPAWIKLLRSGDSFTAFYATTTGTPTASDWIQVGTPQTVAMASRAQVGLAVTSHNNGTLCTGTFTGVSIVADLTAPTLSNGTFNYKTGQSVSLTFSEDVLASLGAGDFVVTNTDTNAVVPAGDFTFGATGGTGVASVATLTHNASAGILPDGHYSVAISNVTDAAGNPMTATNWPFFVLAGDANHDGYVNAQDFTALAQNFNAGSATYDKGDFNYDGQVNALDFNILASRFGAVTAPPVSSEPLGTSAMSAATAPATLFSASPIVDDSPIDVLDTL